MSQSRFVRRVLFILVFLGVFSGGILIGQMRPYQRHMGDALESLRSARHSIGEAIRDMPTRHSQAAMEHVERAIREVEVEVHR
jgi:hypothetical protein